MNLGSRFLLGVIVTALSQTVMWVEMNEEEIGKGENHLGRRGVLRERRIFILRGDGIRDKCRCHMGWAVIIDSCLQFVGTSGGHRNRGMQGVNSTVLYINALFVRERRARHLDTTMQLVFDK